MTPNKPAHDPTSSGPASRKRNAEALLRTNRERFAGIRSALDGFRQQRDRRDFLRIAETGKDLTRLKEALEIERASCLIFVYEVVRKRAELNSWVGETEQMIAEATPSGKSEAALPAPLRQALRTDLETAGELQVEFQNLLDRRPEHVPSRQMMVLYHTCKSLDSLEPIANRLGAMRYVIPAADRSTENGDLVEALNRLHQGLNQMCEDVKEIMKGGFDEHPEAFMLNISKAIDAGNLEEIAELQEWRRAYMEQLPSRCERVKHLIIETRQASDRLRSAIDSATRALVGSFMHFVPFHWESLELQCNCIIGWLLLSRIPKVISSTQEPLARAEILLRLAMEQSKA
ncbi:MAG: hypothetical protein AB7W16_28535 [Candidatus Obscuribacterales bacterium]